MSSPNPPHAAPSDSEPGPPPSLPGAALWGDSEPPPRPGAAAAEFAGLVLPPAKVPTPLPTIGHIGRYALKYQLGAGGIGTVFAAHDPLLSRLIAVKTLKVEVRDDEREAFNAAFINEARAAGGLSHPHIVTVFDAGISDQRAYIAMELLKGRDLRQLRQEGWRATPAQAALIVRRVADALAFAHSRGVIHRDIKPANIFMIGRTQPRVLDFGIARIAHRQESGDPHSGAGSPYYMAPEQMRREPADRRVDVFSLGVVLYELLTDKKPFQGETLADIRKAVLSHEPPLASKVDTGVPKALALIAARAMAKDAEQRFRSARSFARELRQWLDANPAGAAGETVPVPAVPVRRRAPLVWGVAAAAAAVLAGVFWAQSLVAGAGADTAVAALLGGLAAAGSTATAASVDSAPVPTGAREPASPTQVAVEPVAAAASAVPAGAGDGLAAVATSRPVADAAAAPSAAAVAVNTTAVAAMPQRRADVATAAPVLLAAAPRESGKERRIRESRERESREREARQPVQTVAATGTVRIAISPWGQVEVDGAATGAAPPLTELTLAEGRHQIVVRNGDFAPYVASVNVLAGQTVSLRHKFGS